jgi:hypothetical protein
VGIDFGSLGPALAPRPVAVNIVIFAFCTGPENRPSAMIWLYYTVKVKQERLQKHDAAQGNQQNFKKKMKNAASGD